MRFELVTGALQIIWVTPARRKDKNCVLNSMHRTPTCYFTRNKIAAFYWLG
jgi:hypothetical protein